jgi:hypothetical protein
MIFPIELEFLQTKERIEKKLALLRIEWKEHPEKRYITQKQAKMLEIAIFKLDEREGKK